MNTSTLVIFNCILILIIFAIYFTIEPCEECKECAKCPPLPTDGNFLEKEPAPTPQVEQTTNPAPKRRRVCRLDQDSKNVFSTFFKHQCKKTPYKNF
jgi:hypothetical protein